MKITNKLGLPESFVNMATSDYKVTPKRYSATTVLDSIRSMMLRRRHNDEIVEDVSNLVWALFGQLNHAILERAGGGDLDFTEEKLVTEIKDGYQLSGIFDLFSTEKKMVTDYKTCSVFKVMKFDYADWRKQLLMYAWQLRKIGFEVNSGEIVAIMRDWQKSKAKYDKSYPQQQVQRIVFNFSQKDFDEIEQWVSHRFDEIIEAESLSDDELPMCTEEERWYSGDIFAVMKKGRKSALRLLDTEADATDWMEKNGGEYVQHRPGVYRKCEAYCSACEFCSFYKKDILNNGGNE